MTRAAVRRPPLLFSAAVPLRLRVKCPFLLNANRTPSHESLPAPAMRNLWRHIWHLPRNAIVLLIRAYRATLSPDHGPLRHFFAHGVCIHAETCSSYGMRVVRERGAIIGTALTAWRVLHCTPWHTPDAGRVRKYYLTLVHGAWRRRGQDIRLPLNKYVLASGERRVGVREDGLPSHTRIRLRERRGDFSLLEAELKTGRTHQIRVHLSHLGFPIAGDDKYGDFALNKELARMGLKRMFLHACKTVIEHPQTVDARCVRTR